MHAHKMEYFTCYKIIFLNKNVKNALVEKVYSYFNPSNNNFNFPQKNDFKVILPNNMHFSKKFLKFEKF